MAFFSDLGSQSGYITFNCHVSWGSYRLWELVRLFLCLMILTVLRSNGQIFCSISLHLDLSDVFLMFSKGLWVFQRTTTEITDILVHHIRLHTTNLTYLCWYWPRLPDQGWGSVCQLFPLWSDSFTSSPLSMLYFLEGSHYVQPMLKE